MSDSDSLHVLQPVDYDALKQALLTAASFEALKPIIVNKPFEQKLAMAELFLGIIVLLIADKAANTIDRVALSNTELAKNTTDVSYVPFNEIKTPLDHPENIVAQTIRSNKMHDTTDWYYLFTPVLTGEQARINQASGGIAYSAVYPLTANDGGALIFSYFQYEHNIGEAQRAFMQQYSRLVSDRLAAV